MHRPEGVVLSLSKGLNGSTMFFKEMSPRRHLRDVQRKMH